MAEPFFKSARGPQRPSFLRLESLEQRDLLSVCPLVPDVGLSKSGSVECVLDGKGEVHSVIEPGGTIGLPGGASMVNPAFGSSFRSAVVGVSLFQLKTG